MPVDPTKQRKILVVHGVQTGKNEDVNPHKKIQELVEARLNGVPLDFKAEIYKYENINDAALGKLNKVFDAFVGPMLNKVPLGGLLGKVVRGGVDLVGDVLIKVADGSTSRVIRDGLIERIEEFHDKGHPLYIVAHSLGTVYAFDAVNQLIGDSRYFKRDSRKTWPVQGLLTMGSPIGLSMFRRSRIKHLGDGRKLFRWFNYWDPTDPVVSGSFYGKPTQAYRVAEKFDTTSPKCGWFVQDRVIDTGKLWVMAHVAYWRHPGIGDDLATMVGS